MLFWFIVFIRVQCLFGLDRSWLTCLVVLWISFEGLVGSRENKLVRLGFYFSEEWMLCFVSFLCGRSIQGFVFFVIWREFFFWGMFCFGQFIVFLRRYFYVVQQSVFIGFFFMFLMSWYWVLFLIFFTFVFCFFLGEDFLVRGEAVCFGFFGQCKVLQRVLMLRYSFGFCLELQRWF